MLPTLPCMMAEQLLQKQQCLAAGHTRRKKILFQVQFILNLVMLLKRMQKDNILKLLKFHIKDGVTDVEALKELMDDDIAAVIVQYPNFFGQIEPLKEIEEIAHDR